MVKIVSATHEGSVVVIVIRGLIMAFTAVFAAVAFTDPILAWQGLNVETYKLPLAALLALTGEGFMRLLMNLVPKDFSDVVKLLKAWRGK